jgi:hypothetical protein
MFMPKPSGFARFTRGCMLSPASLGSVPDYAITVSFSDFAFKLGFDGSANLR